MRISFKMVKKSDRVEKWLEKSQHTGNTIQSVLDECGKMGVDALVSGTPKDTGKTAASWSYETEVGPTMSTIYWTNDNVTHDGDPIVILLQMGHGTGTGGYVAGRDFINPAMKPVFDAIEDKVWKAVVEL